ncbi:MAG: peptidylprolyl isomerase [bacterium]
MKRLTVICMVLFIFALCACNSSKKSAYKKGSPEYEFLVNTADSLNLPVLNPENTATLIKTNDFTVKNTDIMTELYGYFYNNGDRIKNAPVAQLENIVQRIAANNAINTMLISTAKENDILVAESEVDSQIEELTEKHGSKENLENALAQQNMSMDQLRENIKTSMIISDYFSDYFYNNVSVPEEAIKKWYNNTYATVRHILLMTQNKSNEEKTKIYRQMEQILEQARSGKDFAELAKKYSEDQGSQETGGLYENFPRGQMVKPFEEASFNTPVGEISDIVATQYGYHIIKVLNRTKDTRPYEEVKKDIHVKLAQETNPDVFTQVVDSLKQEVEFEEVYPQSNE